MTAATRRRKKVSGTADRQYAAGKQAGFKSGWQDGYWMGKCARTMQAAETVVPVRPIHVMYVATGKGYPYSPLDEALASTLQTVAARVTVAAKENVVELAAAHRPDIVLVLDGIHFDLAAADAIRAMGIRTAVWFTDDPYYTDITSAVAQRFDDVFTLERNCVDFYRTLGCQRVYHLPLGVFPGHYRPTNPSAGSRREIAFIGSAYWNRVAMFDELAPYLKQKDIRISGIWWDRLRAYKSLESKIELGRWMTPQETADAYAGARIVINLHRAHDDDTFNNNSIGLEGASPNPRTFEISACATLQLTDARSDIAAHYVPGREIETYASPGELIAKIEYYLNREEERRAIALNGLYRTMRDHTYARRFEAMFAMLFGG